MCSVEAASEAALEASHGFAFGFALGDASGDVGQGVVVVGHSFKSDGVDCPVESAVAASVEVVAGGVPRRCADGGGPFESGLADEPPQVGTDLTSVLTPPLTTR